jgi:hypothetical protein
MRNSLHIGAVKRFFTEDFCVAAGAGIWTAHRLNPLWVRCPSCARATDLAQADCRTCGGPAGWSVSHQAAAAWDRTMALCHLDT